MVSLTQKAMARIITFTGWKKITFKIQRFSQRSDKSKIWKWKNLQGRLLVYLNQKKVPWVSMFITVRQGNWKCQKISQWFSRVPYESPQWELQNEPPLDRSWLTPEIPFMASLWIRSGYDMKVEKSAETYQVGAHFKALIKAILVAPLKSFERFFSDFVFPCRTVHLNVTT